MKFKEISKAEWLRKVEKDLKGKPVSSLDWEPAPGFVVSPFAHPDDRTETYEPLLPHRKTNVWTPGVVLDAGDASSANRAALALLNNGAGALRFVLSEPLGRTDWSILLKDIRADWIELHVDASRLFQPFDASPLADHLRAVGQLPSDIRGSFYANSITGRNDFPAIVATYLPAETFHDTDAQILEEMQQLREGLKRLYESSSDRPVCVGLRPSDHYLLSIAKFRAVRTMWQQLGGAAEQLILHAYVGPFTPGSDEHTNKIRATTRCMAAVVSGVDTVFVYPSDATSPTDGSDFNRRISLNIHHLLQMESYLDRAVDPAAGSYYLEGLTERLLENTGSSVV